MTALVRRYTKTAIALHWLIAAMILTNLLIVWTVDVLPEDRVRAAINLHKSIGLTVLGLVIVRFLWRQTHTPPPLPAEYPTIEKRGAHAVHLIFYAVMFALPLTGWMHDSAFKGAAEHPLTIFGLPWFRIGAIASLPQPQKEHWHDVFFSWHAAAAYALYALFVLHIGGALKHQFIDKKPELQRMSPL